MKLLWVCFILIGLSQNGFAISWFEAHEEQPASCMTLLTAFTARLWEMVKEGEEEIVPEAFNESEGSAPPLKEKMD